MSGQGSASARPLSSSNALQVVQPPQQQQQQQAQQQPDPTFIQGKELFERHMEDELK